MNKDSNPHPSVQPWSRGPIFPGVISRIEERLPYYTSYYTAIQWQLDYPGTEPQRYATYDDAYQQARGLNRAAAMKLPNYCGIVAFGVDTGREPSVTTVGWGHCKPAMTATELNMRQQEAAKKTEHFRAGLPDAYWRTMYGDEKEIVRLKNGLAMTQQNLVIARAAREKTDALLAETTAKLRAMQNERIEHGRLTASHQQHVADIEHLQKRISGLDDQLAKAEAERLTAESQCNAAVRAANKFESECDILSEKLIRLRVAVARHGYQHHVGFVNDVWNGTAP